MNTGNNFIWKNFGILTCLSHNIWFWQELKLSLSLIWKRRQVEIAYQQQRAHYSNIWVTKFMIKCTLEGILPVFIQHQNELGSNNYATCSHVGDKGIFNYSNDIILWHESEGIKNKIFPKFQLIPILRLQVMYDYVVLHCSIDYCVELRGYCTTNQKISMFCALS